MCLYTIQTKTRIAKKDIHVYKVLEVYAHLENPISPFYETQYELNKVYTSNIGFWNTIRADGIIRRLSKTNYKTYKVSEGLHSYLSLPRALCLQKKHYLYRVIFEAVIPKGSLYICGIRGDIVSNQLIILKEHQF